MSSILSKLNITFLDEFSISYQGNTVNERIRRSSKMWTLFKYLVIFKDREISQDELINLLWKDKKTENPIGALKTQLHRLRTMLSELGVKENIIINTHGAYAFNKSANYTIDAEEFEKLCQNAARETDIKSRIDIILKAVDLYKNDFLLKNSNEEWVSSLTTYYRSLYLRIVRDGVELLKAEDKPHEIISICERAVHIDPEDEYLHCALIEALAKTGNRQGVKVHYNYVVNLFNTKLNIQPPLELIESYNKAIGAAEEKTASFSEVISGLSERKSGRGAFYCEYELFKYIYRLELRGRERYKKNISLFLITLNNIGKNEVSGEIEALGEIIKNSLRMSDIYTRCSICQYIILLHNTAERNFASIIERIKKKYIKEFPSGHNCFKSEFHNMMISSEELKL